LIKLNRQAVFLYGMFLINLCKSDYWYQGDKDQELDFLHYNCLKKFANFSGCIQEIPLIIKSVFFNLFCPGWPFDMEEAIFEINGLDA
jgi:hypothetical protein